MEIAHRICLMSLLAWLLAAPLSAEAPRREEQNRSNPAFRKLMTESFKVKGEPARSKSTDGSIPGRLRDPAVHSVQHNEVSELPPEPSRFRLAQSDLLDDLLKDLDEEPKAEDEKTEDSADTEGEADIPPKDGATTETMPPGEDADIVPLDEDEGPANVGTPETNQNRRNAAPSSPTLRSSPRKTTKPKATTSRSGSSVSTGTANASRPQGLNPEARRAAYAAQPYTLAGILDDDKAAEECCEQEFCEAMWNCNGGRNLPWHVTWQRNWNNSFLSGGRSNSQCSPMRDWKCSTRQGAGYGNMGMPYGNPGPYPYNGQMAPIHGEPTPAPNMDGIEVLPDGQRIEGLPIEPQPLPDLDAKVRRARPSGAVGEPIVVADRRANSPKR